MKVRAEVVVIGGGILGCGVAYELARLGLTDIVLLEKNELTAGTTWHSAGQLLLLDDDVAIARINAMSIDIYSDFQKQTGEDIGLHQEGSIRLATTPNRLERLQRLTEKMAAMGFHSQMIEGEEIKRRFPLINLDGVLGANWSPREGRVDPSMTTHAYARLARKLGVEIHRNNAVRGVTKEGGHWRVESMKGTITADHVIVAAGFWAPSILRDLRVNVPILPSERQYLITEEVPELKNLSPQLPILRDYDVPFYFRQEGAGLLMGVHEPHTPFCFEKGIPDDFGQELFDPDLGRGAACIEAGMIRVPKLAEVGIRRVICGPTSRTVDFNGLLGPVPGHKNLHLLAGFSAGIGHGAAVTRLLAEWMVKGSPSLDVSPLHASRFGDFATHYYIRQMLGEAHTYGSLDISKERRAGRRARTSPLYHRHKASGALFAVRRGWECPTSFPAGSESPAQASARETEHVLQGCGVLDLTARGRIDISGPGARALLAKLGGGNVAIKAGESRIYTFAPLPHEPAFPVLVAALTDNDFYLSVDPENSALLLAALTQLGDDTANIREITSNYAALALIGKTAANTFAALVSPMVDINAFKPGCVASVDVGYAPARVLRYEIGGLDVWEIHVAFEYVTGLDELIHSHGERVADIGFHALEQLRSRAAAAKSK